MPCIMKIQKNKAYTITSDHIWTTQSLGICFMFQGKVTRSGKQPPILITEASMPTSDCRILQALHATPFQDCSNLNVLLAWLYYPRAQIYFLLGYGLFSS